MTSPMEPQSEPEERVDVAVRSPAGEDDTRHVSRWRARLAWCPGKAPPAGSLVGPESIAAAKRLHVRARANAVRPLLDQFRVPAANHDILGLERRLEPGDDTQDVLAPLLRAQAFEAALPQVVLVSPALLVRQVAKLHRFQIAVDDEGGPEAGAEPE